MKTNYLLILLFLPAILTAQYSFTQIEINPGSGDSKPRHFTEFNGMIYFSAIGPQGRELYKTDGTAAGTQLVADINPGTGGSFPRRLTVLNNLLYFTADEPSTGRELWVTDGTAAGTLLVKDNNVGIGDGVGSAWEPFTIFNNELYYGAVINGQGTFLHKSDGTLNGTEAITARISTRNDLNFEASLTVFANNLYFEGFQNNTGAELYFTDGTDQGTQLFEDYNPGSSDSRPIHMFIYNNQLYFRADDGQHGRELCNIDNGVITNVKDLWTGPASSSPGGDPGYTVFENNIYFLGRSGNNSGVEMYVSDGTETGTTQFVDILTGDAGGFNGTSSYDKVFFTVGDRMYFGASNSRNAGNVFDDFEPYFTDGTAAGTLKLADLNTSGNGVYTSDSQFFEFDGKVFFDGVNLNNPNSSASWLYAYDPILNTVERVTPANSSFDDIQVYEFYLDSYFVFQNKLFIPAQFDINGVDNGGELWVIEPAAASVDTFDKESVTIFPNPANDHMILQGIRDNSEMNMYDLNGRLLLNKTIGPDSKIDLTSFRSGVYLIQVGDFSKKLIINR